MVAAPIPLVLSVVHITNDDRIALDVALSKFGDLVVPTLVRAGLKVGVDDGDTGIGPFVTKGGGGDEALVNDFVGDNIVIPEASRVHSDYSTNFGVVGSGSEDMVGEGAPEGGNIAVTRDTDILQTYNSM